MPRLAPLKERGKTTDTITLPAKDNEPIVALTKGVQIHNELIMLRRAAQKALRRCFARSKREGDLPKHSNPDSLARFITTVYQGMVKFQQRYQMRHRKSRDEDARWGFNSAISSF